MGAKMMPEDQVMKIFDEARDVVHVIWQDEARALLCAIAWQESRCTARVQYGGPAHGLWQFEKGGGVHGVIRHSVTLMLAREACSKRNVICSDDAVYEALPHDDVLAAVFARLLISTLPAKLPTRDQQGEAWNQYIDAWRPGVPRPETWPEAWRRGWEAVDRWKLRDDNQD